MKNDLAARMGGMLPKLSQLGIRLLALILFCLFVAGIATGEVLFENDAQRKGASQSVIGIRAFAASSQLSAPAHEDSPFLWAGQPLSDPDARVAQQVRDIYDPVRLKYPSVANCIEEGTDFGGDLTGARLLWHELPARADVEVCLFRLFTKLGTLASIESWLTNLGFSDRQEVDHSGLAHIYGVESAKITQFSMRWNTRRNGALYGTPKERTRLEQRTIHSTVTVRFAEGIGVIGLRIFDQSRWLK